MPSRQWEGKLQVV
jgi:hypothetical protein